MDLLLCAQSWRMTLVTILLFAGVSSHAQDIYISEVVPDNGGAFLDADGDASDWIELYNNTAGHINLAGWHLTDNAASPTQWTFPATNIAPGGLLVVFASDKDRAVSGSELHTNFKLKSSGEYVALVRPDGSTEDGFTFPELGEGVSFGREFTALFDAVVLDEGATCTYHIPESAADQLGWQQPYFDDSTWSTGRTAVGYDARSGFESVIKTSLLEMRYRNLSAYLRIPFHMASPETATGLRLEMKYDDGFVAYLNGARLFAENTDGTEEWNSGAGEPGNDTLALEYETFDLSPYLAHLQAGTNWLAIHALNDSTDLQDMLILPRLVARQSSGFNTGAPQILEAPTPGRPNAPAEFEGYVSPPTVFPPHGICSSAQTVDMACSTTGAVIRYTLDGSEPTTNSTAYTQPLEIGSTTTLRARAFKTGWEPSFPRTETYIFPEEVVAQPADSYKVNGQQLVFGMDPEVVAGTYTDAAGQPFDIHDALKAIPSLCITTDPDNLFDPDRGIYVNAYERWERAASLELIDPDGSEDFNINAGLRIRGGYSRNPSNPKHSFRFFFREKYGEAKLEFPLFGDEGVDEFDKIDLRTAQNYSWAWSKDPRNTLLRDVFCRDAAAAMGAEYTRSRYYHVYLNGTYWGIYMTEERPEARHAAAYMGGNKDDYDTIKRKSGRNGVEATDGNLHAFERMFDATMHGFTNNADYFAVQGMDANGQPDPAKERLADLENMIDYLLLIYYSAATDNCITWFHRNSSVNNMYAVYNRENPDGFKWFQHDCEHAFDTSQELDRTGPFDHENFRLEKFFNAQTMHEKLCVNEEYRLAFADRVFKHFSNNGALTQAACEARLDERMAQLDRAIVAHAARWGNAQLNRDCWLLAAERIRNFFDGRGDDVIGYLEKDGLIPSIAPPTAYTTATGISLSSDEGAIYYTLDGSDPRAIGGAVAGQAYAGTIPLSQPTLVKTRARKPDGEWSALCEKVFLSPTLPLAFTEVMYHGTSNQLDFIELQNISTDPVNLAHYALGKAVKQAFGNGTLAPGAYALAAKDTNALLAAHSIPPGTLLFEYGGNLDNSGGDISLEFAGDKLFEIAYSDARNWPQAADGGGHSLVPILPANDSKFHYGGNWLASAHFGGSPGADDPTVAPSVVINEINAHTDTGLEPPFDSNDQIELHNPTGASIDIGGWYLSDTLDELHRWEVPAGTTIPAGGYLLFDEDDFHPARTNGFGLDKAGELVVLSSPSRIVDCIRFKGQPNGKSYGRWPSGATLWFTMPPTPGAANSIEYNPVLLTEFLYHPAEGDEELEYVQMLNVTGGTVDLSTEAGTWRLTGGIEFAFPQDFAMASGEFIWIVPFNPEENPELLARFCGAHGLNPATDRIIGAYRGKLSNRGDRIAIEYPQPSDDPEKPDDISWVVVDEVFYSDQSPWPPEADGTGRHLYRSTLSEWQVSAPE